MNKPWLEGNVAFWSDIAIEDCPYVGDDAYWWGQGWRAGKHGGWK